MFGFMCEVMITYNKHSTGHVFSHNQCIWRLVFCAVQT